MKKVFQNSALRTIGVVSFVSVIFIYLTFNWFIQFSSFSVGLAKGALGIFLFWVIDEFAIKGVDTLTELRKGNTAYALFLLGIAVIISAAILNS